MLTSIGLHKLDLQGQVITGDESYSTHIENGDRIWPNNEKSFMRERYQSFWKWGYNSSLHITWLTVC